MPATTLPVGARCPVCGVAVGDAPWRCANCETPHHADCAQYFGGCGIYGCRDGNRPQPVERASWPAALHALRRVTIARHIQTASLLTCIAALAAMIATFIVYPLQHWLVVFGQMSLGGAVTYMLMDALVLDFLRWRLRRELGANRSPAIEISTSRAAHAVPGALHAAQRFRWLDRVGDALLAFGLVTGVAISGRLMLFVMVGAMCRAAADQLRKHLTEIEVSLHRFQATYAPPALIKEEVAFDDTPEPRG